MDYLVDIIMPVYNHANYLTQAIEGVVNQKTLFKFRLLIGDDCSKDNSREVILKYAEQYPDIIHPVLHGQNKGSTGNAQHLIALVTSRYMGICEGDDYWTDDHKLQKQIDFLEANPDFTVCFTRAGVVNEINEEWPYAFVPLKKDVFTFADIVQENVIPTATVIYRNVFPKPFPDFIYRMLAGDWILHMMALSKGNAKFIDEQTAVYRRHSGGLTNTEDYQRKHEELQIIMFEEMNKYLDYKYDAVFRKQILVLARRRLISGSRHYTGKERRQHIISAAKKYLKYSSRENLKEMPYYFVLLFFPWMLKPFKKIKAA